MSSREDASRSSDDFDRVLAAARRGEKSQLGILLDVYGGFLLSVATATLSPDIVAKVAPSDLVQVTLIQASQAFDGFKGSTLGEWHAWLRQILENEGTDTHRHYRNAAKRDISKEVSLHSVSTCDGGPFDPMSTEPSPSTRARAAESVRIVEQGLKKLNEHYRQAIQWRNFDQLGFEEIGRRFGLTEDAARKLWVRAVENLTLELRPDDTDSARTGSRPR